MERIGAVIVMVGDGLPALVLLADDERLAGFLPGVQRTELLLESFLGRMPACPAGIRQH
jgi:hypothetical protein